MKDEKHATAFTVEVVIEIPQGSRNKFEWDEARRVIRLDRRIPGAVSYPAHYGSVPGTLAVDGDPLDALVLAEGRLYPGVWLTARPIGVGWVRDNGQLEPKLLCVPDADASAAPLGNITDVPALLLEEIGQFFDVYKLLEPTRDRHMERWGNRNEAHKTIRKARKAYRKANATFRDTTNQNSSRSFEAGSAHQLVKLLCDRNTTLGIAESCTGGLIASAIAATDGAGDCFRGAIVAYDAAVKYDLLGVTPGADVINKPAAQAMATGARRLLGADIGLATTGVIGPDSTEGQPVGTIWIGIACEDEHPVANRINIEHHDPATIRALAASDAMQLLAHHMNRTRQ